MIKTTGIVKLNASDAICYHSPEINITAVAIYTDAKWILNAIAKIVVGETEAKKEYIIPVSEIVKVGDDKLMTLSNLGQLLETMIAQDIVSQSAELGALTTNIVI